jgi:hypothetical protein
MGALLAVAAVVGICGAVLTVRYAYLTLVGMGESLNRMDAQVSLMDRQLEAMDRQLETMGRQLDTAQEAHEVALAARDAAGRLARIEALERAADAASEVADVADEAQRRHYQPGTPTEAMVVPLELAPLLPVARGRLAVAVSAVLALGGRHLATCHALAWGSEHTSLVSIRNAAPHALREVDSALEDERRAAAEAQP